MKTDLQLKADVTSELAWDPSINAAAIGIMVKDGVVTLTGHLDSYVEKQAVERAVRHMAGVRGVELELDVELSADHKRSDSDIAKAALAALSWHSLVPPGRITVEVEDGWITLGGEVDWHYQLASAEDCITPLIGVRGLINKISIKGGVSQQDLPAAAAAPSTRGVSRVVDRLAVEA